MEYETTVLALLFLIMAQHLISAEPLPETLVI